MNDMKIQNIYLSIYLIFQPPKSNLFVNDCVSNGYKSMITPNLLIYYY